MDVRLEEFDDGCESETSSQEEEDDVVTNNVDWLCFCFSNFPNFSFFRFQKRIHHHKNLKIEKRYGTNTLPKKKS